MGQRSQLIVKLPEAYWNENNPNNKPMRLKVYHNQWLYGSHFIQYLGRLLNTLKYYSEKDINFIRDSESILDKSIKHCNNADIDYPTNTNIYEEGINNYNKDFCQSKSVMDWLKTFDNNNGYMYIDMTTKSLKYCILNGSENDKEIKVRTPREYINQFYKDKEIIDGCDWKLLRALERLKKFKTVDIFKDLDLFREQLVIKAL